MDIKVLGPNCDNCFKIEALVRDVTTEMGVGAVIEKVTDPQAWTVYDLLFTPGLVIDDKLVCAGRQPAKIEVMRWVAAAAGLPEPD